MVDQQRTRLEKAISNLIEEVYKSHFKKLQRDMHVCAARCCSDDRGNLDSVQNCIEGCTTPLLRAQDYLQHELGQFQGRLQNCIMECNDSARTKSSNEYQYHYDRCTVKCVDQHISLIPAMMKQIQNVLSKGPKS